MATMIEVVRRKDELRYKARIRKYLFGKKLIEVCRTFDSRQGAKRWLEEAKQIEKKEGYKGLVYLKRNKKVTVGCALDKLMSDEAFLKTTSQKVISNLKMLKKFSIAKIELAYLMPSHLLEFVEERKAKNPKISPATLSVDISNLSSALKEASSVFVFRLDEEVLKKAWDLLKKRKLIKQSTPRERLLSEEEEARLTKHLHSSATSFPLNDIVDLLKDIGARRGELTKIQWSDFDEKRKTLTIRERKSPNEHKPTSRIKLTSVQVALITRQKQHLKKGDSRIFPYNKDSISAAFRKVIRDAGIHDYQLRDLKAHAITTMYKAGKSLEEIGKITGNQSTQILYDHYLRLIELSTR